MNRWSVWANIVVNAVLASEKISCSEEYGSVQEFRFNEEGKYGTL